MNLKSTFRNLIFFSLLAVVGGWWVDSSIADESETKDPFAQVDPKDDPYGARRIPEALVNIGVDDSNNGNVIDFNTPFRDHKNNLVRTGDLFDGTRPVIMSFNYSDCPKLCSVQLENMIDALSQIDLKIGADFQMTSISIDPKETPERSQQQLDIYTRRYNLASAREGLHFLVGEQASIAKITDECGFKYKYVESQKRYSHPPLFLILSPKGKIVRYIHGLDYDPNTMKLALVEAAEGKIGSPLNLASYGLGCFVFDETTGKYTFQAMALMRGAAFLTVFILVITLVPYWFFRRGAGVRQVATEATLNETLTSKPEVSL